jgi:hypothetical protein
MGPGHAGTRKERGAEDGKEGGVEEGGPLIFLHMGVDAEATCFKLVRREGGREGGREGEREGGREGERGGREGGREKGEGGREGEREGQGKGGQWAIKTVQREEE